MSKPATEQSLSVDDERKDYHRRQSLMSLWITPLSGLIFLGIAWGLDWVFPIPVFVYAIIIVVLGMTWIGDLINVVVKPIKS